MTDGERLRLFDHRVSELLSCRMMQTGFHAGVTVKWERTRGLTFENHDPDEDDLRSFLLTFRQFVSAREPVYLNRVNKLCEQQLRSDGLRESLRRARAHWRKALTGSGFVLVINGRAIEPEEVADLWINGHYFHTDTEKGRNLLESGIALPMFRYAFLDFLVEATRQVVHTGNIVRAGLRDDMFACDSWRP